MEYRIKERNDNITCHLANQKQAFNIATDMIVTLNSVVDEFCFATFHPVSQERPISSAGNARFKPKTGFKTEKPSFSRQLPFSPENLDYHHISCFTVVKHDVQWLTGFITAHPV